MKTSWRLRTLGELCQLISGQHINSQDYNTESRGIGYLTGPSDFGAVHPVVSKWTEYPKTIAKSGDILVTVKGSGVGKINLLDQDEVAISRQLMAIRVTDVDPRFIYTFLSSTFDQLQSLSTGAAIPGISREQILSLRLSVPPPSEQQRIVGILDDAFESITVARVNAEKNLQNAHELFTNYLNYAFSQRGKEGTERVFSDVCEISSTLVDPQNESFLDLLHVGGANIVSKTGELIGLKTVREEELISRKFFFDKTMVLYNKIRPYLMKVARPDFQGLCSADIYPLSAKQELLDRNYLFYLLLSTAFTEYAIAGSARTGIPKVNRDHLFGFHFYLPKLVIQEKIAAQLDGLSAETRRLESIYERKLAALDELKKSLLHRAFTGQL